MNDYMIDMITESVEIQALFYLQKKNIGYVCL